MIKHKATGTGRLFCCYTPMHEVTPKVVAMAELLENCNELF